MSTAMIVLAGGSGSRMDPSMNKVYRTVGNRSVLAYSLDTFERASLVDRVVLVVRPGDRPRAAASMAEVSMVKRCSMVDGGASRQESEIAGLEALASEIESGQIELVAIHDGARPFATLDLIDSLFVEAGRRGGAIPAVPVEETLYRAIDGYAIPLPTGALARVQTPQVFAAGPLLAAYRAAARVGFNGFDTAETMERFSTVTVGVVAGDVRNIKLTISGDFALAEELAHRWKAGRWE